MVRAIDVKTAAYAIRSYLAEQLQDLPENSDDAEGDRIDPQSVHWMAADASFWINIHGGFTLETYKRTSYLVLQQLHRAWRCSHPRVERNADGTIAIEMPRFVNLSDSMVGVWQRAHRERVASKIRANNHERAQN